MCAIAGFYAHNYSQGMLEYMLECMRARGTDGRYCYCDNHFYAGMNRLSINDVEHGQQPFCCGDSVVFFNGEIYNHALLRHEFDDVRFKTHCDGEILPHLYARYGVECFGRLDGMFGICVYDKRKQWIILARDIIGEKPLYYTHRHGFFGFSSLVMPLRHGYCDLNPQALWDFFTFGFIPEPQSIFKDIFALPYGHYAIYDIQHNRLSLHAFAAQNRLYFSSDVDCEEQTLLRSTERLVCESIKDRMLSDVSIGAFLSGGLDSSIVASVARRYSTKLDTFNIAFVDDYDPYCGFANESHFAQLVAGHIGSVHHEIRVDAQSYQAYLSDFIQSIDQPYGAVSGIGVKIIARCARELGIKVLLSGDGADEMFGGYAWYPKLRFNDTRFISAHKPKGWHYYAFEHEKQAFLNMDYFEGLQSLGYFPPLDAGALEFIQFDRDFYLPFEMMSKLDRMSMSEGVEGRACFVSPKIIHFTRMLDYEQLLKHGGKWLLAHAFMEYVPRAIIEREKHGFNPPIDYWMHNAWKPLVQQALEHDSILHKLGILAPNAPERFMYMFDTQKRRFGNIAFYLVVLNHWLRGVYG